jgi:hypothetical protein
MPQPIVIVIVKAARAGQVKTRLVPPLSESGAASLAACFARDTLLKARRVVRNVLVAYAPSDARNDLEAILPRAYCGLSRMEPTSVSASTQWPNTSSVYDIDTPADLKRLRDEMRSREEARRRAPSTYRWLAQRASQLSLLP